MQAKYEWKEREFDSENAAKLSDALELPDVIARVLAARGFAEPDEARTFLYPDIRRDLCAPCKFPGIAAATGRIRLAVRRGEYMIIFGDFDVDGVCAAAILKKTLDALGACSDVFLPLREQEGYGLTAAAVERCLAQAPVKPGLIITVDCGIGSVGEVAMLNERGVEVIITDHHEPGEILPGAVAVVNPHCGASPGAAHLCGAGVAFKLAHALVQSAQQDGVGIARGFAGGLVVAAGLATVADIVPLKGENRLLASSAMKLWKNFAGTGLHALMNRALQRQQDMPDAYTFGFVLGPRINAAGRMGSAMVAYELLMTEDKERACELAARLEGFNGERRGVQNRILELARAQCGLDKGQCETAAIVVGGTENTAAPDKDWHTGVAGIVASQLSEEGGRPAAVIVFDQEGGGRGSVRAGNAYHALDALGECTEVLDGFGGHARAAGFQLKQGMFDEFKKLFCSACARQIGDECPVDHLLFESWLTADQINFDLFRFVSLLAPFGLENRMPRWAVRDLEVVDARAMGGGRDHMQLVLKTGDAQTIRAVWFKCGDLTGDICKGHRVDLLFEMVHNDYRGSPELELRIVDMRRSVGSPVDKNDTEY